jgi:hypothetical protein
MQGFQNHKPSKMCFIDGAQFIQYMSGLGQRPPVEQTENNLPSFILQEFEKVISNNFYRDEDLVAFFNHLLTRVEDAMLPPARQSYTAPNWRVLNTRRAVLHALQFQRRVDFWVNHIKHLRPAAQDFKFDFNDVEFKLALQLINSVYDFGALMKLLEPSDAQKLCDSLQDKLPQWLNTPRAFNALMVNLKHEEGAEVEMAKKMTMVYAIMKEHLVAMPQSVHEVVLICQGLVSIAQLNELLEAGLFERLPELIISVNHILHCVCKNNIF